MLGLGVGLLDFVNVGLVAARRARLDDHRFGSLEARCRSTSILDLNTFSEQIMIVLYFMERLRRKRKRSIESTTCNHCTAVTL
jgi:hypothetical protein